MATEFRLRLEDIPTAPRGSTPYQKVVHHGWTETASGCWEYNGLRDRQGYGIVHIPRSQRRAHRVVYEELVGPIPNGKMLLHSCDNPPCINPEHLSPGTAGENRRDSLSKGRVPFGEKHAGCKLSSSDVDEIRRLYATGNYTQLSLAKQFGCSTSQMNNIVKNRQRING